MIVRPRWLAPLVAAVAVSSLAACGGGGGSDNTTPQTLTPALAVLGQSAFNSAAANAPSGVPSAGGLNQPLGAAYDSASGQFFIPDRGNNRILGYTSVPTVTGTAANFVIGQASFDAVSPNRGGAVVQNGLAFPQSVWVGLDTAAGNNKLVVADTLNHRVLIWNTVPTTDVAPDVVVGQPDFVSGSAAAPPSAATLSAPTSAVIANGKLIVADQGNNRVLIWNAVPTANGVAADIVLGQPSFVLGFPNAAPSSGVTGSQNADTLSAPSGLWSDGFRLLVADTGNSRVLYWTSIPTTIQARANFVLGQSSFTFSTTAVSSQTMNSPIGVTSDGARVFVADSVNNRVTVFNSFPLANGAAANEVLGQQNFGRNTFNDDNGDSENPQNGVAESAPTRRTLNNPQGVFYVGAKLYVTDSGNNRVMIYDGVNIPVPGNR